MTQTTLTQPTLTQIVEQRKSIREFTDQAVEPSLIKEILVLAGQSASGSNLQPWNIYVVTGAIKQQLSDTVIQKAQSNPMGESPDIPIYPNPLEDRWNKRRKACAEVMYDALGIPREEKLQRVLRMLENYRFFGAPVGMIITMDRSLCDSQLVDLGIFMQSIMLLAKERGLDTCPQAIWSMWPDTIRETLGIAHNERVINGLSLGYADNDAPVNHIQQARMAADEYIHFME